MLCVERLVRTVGYRTGVSIKCEKHADFNGSFLFCLHTRGKSAVDKKNDRIKQSSSNSHILLRFYFIALSLTVSALLKH